jgi:hypothetical protein
MISSYFTDVIRIVTVSTDEWGVKTQTESADIKCRVEDLNELIKDDMGQEVIGEMCIFLRYTETLNFGDKVMIKTKSGMTYNQPDKMFIVKKRSQRAMFSSKYLEIIV